jgi:hypothetical protein
LTLAGALDEAAMLYCWRQLVQRHAVLRTGFAWKGLARPVQVVLSRVDLFIDQRDWRGMSSQSQERELERYLVHDRNADFDLERPPLMRLMVARASEVESKLAWSFHHIQLDGWCLSIVIEELQELYCSAVGGRTRDLDEPARYRRFIEWLQLQGSAQAQVFWEHEFQGFAGNSLLTGNAQARPTNPETVRTITMTLSREATARLAGFARARRLTVNTTILGAWAVTLAHHIGTDDVLFGTVVSGRPPDLPDVERMVGLFINTLPLRVRLEPNLTVLTMLESIQAAQVRMRRYEHCSLSQIKKWAGIAGNHELFDTIVAFENYPWRDSPQERATGLRITGIRAEEQTNLPLVLAAVPGDELALKLSYSESLFNDAAVSRLLEQLELMLGQMPLCFDQPVAVLLHTVQPECETRLTRPIDGHEIDTAGMRPIVGRMTSNADQREKEEILAPIWAEVLGVAEARPDDNFYALGGDSILSMQVCSRAAGFGLKLTPGQILRERTLRSVAALAARQFDRVAEVTPVVGQLPLTPIQHWFFELNLDDPDTYNQSVLFKTAHALNPVAILSACQFIINHHDALRLRFRQGAGGVDQKNEGPPGNIPFVEADLYEMPQATIVEAIGTLAASVFRSISLTRGRLIRVVLFKHGAQSEQWLLFVVHHLAIDGVSWRILLQDFWTAYDLAESGRAVVLGRRTTSFKDWAHLLTEYAVSDRAKAQKEYWDSQTGASFPRLPVDTPEGLLLRERPQTLAFELEPEDTRALLTAVRDGVQAALLAALAQSLIPWLGVPRVLVDVEGHGRQPLSSDVDLSHTVGWFTATYPLLISTENAGGWAERTHRIAEQLGGVPDGGIGYGALRYLSRILTPASSEVNQHPIDGTPEVAPSSENPADLNQRERRFLPEVSLNYLGQFDQSLRTAEKHASPADWAGPLLSSAKLAHLIEVNAMVTGGSLVVTILFDESLYRTATIEGLGQKLLSSLREIVAAARLLRQSAP